jgi:hypothetical protein
MMPAKQTQTYFAPRYGGGGRRRRATQAGRARDGLPVPDGLPCVN